MLLKRTFFFIPFFFVILSLDGQEKATVAVLDTVLEGGDIPRNASSVAAVYLNDSFAASADYVPLDRSSLYTSWYARSPGDINIVSLVQRKDYAKLGELLGADFLCLSTLGRDGGGYLITTELFDTARGGVISRETARADRLVEIPNAARLAGSKLSGASPTALPEVTAPLTAAEPSPQTAPSPEPSSPREEVPRDSVSEETPPQPSGSGMSEREAPEKQKTTVPGGAKPFGSMTLSLLLPSYMGNEDFSVSLDGGSTYTKTPLYDSGLGDNFDWGMDFNVRITGSSVFCFDLGCTIASQLITYDTYYYGEETSMSFGFFDFYLGVGAVLPLTENLQLVGVGTLGYGVLLLGADIWDYDTISNYDESTGITSGITAGVDFKMSSDLVLTLRYKLSISPELDPLGTDFGYNGLLLGFGTTF